MEKIFRIDQIDQTTIHFSFLKQGDHIVDACLYDTNSMLPIHLVNGWKLSGGFSYYISSHPDAGCTKNWSLKIELKTGEYQIENFKISTGEDRTPVILGKRINIIHDNNPAYYTLVEIFYKKVYERDFVRIEKDDIIVDIGANIGMFCLYAQDFYPSQIVAIEPGPDQFRCLIENSNLYQNIKSHNIAITDKDKKINLLISDLGVTNRIENLEYDISIKDSIIRPVEIQSMNINTFLKSQNISKIDYLKMDCEGSELLIFQSIDKKFLSNKIKKIVLEYHSIEIRNQILDIIKKADLVLENQEILENRDEIGMLYIYNPRLFEIQSG